MIEALIAFAVGVSQNATWDLTKAVVRRFTDTGRISFEQLLSDAFENAIRSTQPQLDSIGRHTLKILLTRVKQRPSEFIHAMSNFDAISFGGFLQSIESQTYQQTVAKTLIETYLDGEKEPFSSIIVQIINRSLAEYRMFILDAISSDQILRVVLQETVKIGDVILQLEEIKGTQEQSDVKLDQIIGLLTGLVTRNAENASVRIKSGNAPSTKQARRHPIREASQLSPIERSQVFPHSLVDLPSLFVSQSIADVVFVTGVGDYELLRLGDRQKRQRLTAKAVKPVSNYVYISMFPAMSALYYRLGLMQGTIDPAAHEFFRSDVEISDDFARQHNFVSLSGGDVNSFSTRVITEFERVYRVHVPIRFMQPGSSECIFSSLSRRIYNERDEIDDRFIAFLVLLPNPWNAHKAILLAAGNRVLGTVATLRLLTECILGRVVVKNHPNYPDVPARVIVSSGLDTSRKRVLATEFIE